MPPDETGLVEDQRPLGIGDDPVALADYEVSRGLANVDAMVGIRGMAEDTLVFFVEGVHGPPGERNVSLQFAGVRGQAGVMPRPSRRDVLLVRGDDVPGSEPEIGVLGGVFNAFEDVGRNVGLRKVGYRIAARLEQQEDVLAFGNPLAAEAHAHASTQTLDIQ